MQWCNQPEISMGASFLFPSPPLPPFIPPLLFPPLSPFSSLPLSSLLSLPSLRLEVEPLKIQLMGLESAVCYPSKVWNIVPTEIIFARSGGNNFNYFPKNKLTKLANFVQFKHMLMFCLEDWGACPSPLVYTIGCTRGVQ